MTALVLLTHEDSLRVKRMVDYWHESTHPAVIVVAYGGPRGEFDKLECRKVFIEDPRLRTRDHQRERQSYTGVLRGALEEIANDNWEWLYLAEYDMLPLDQRLFERLENRARYEGADLLGHRMWRLDDTLHPHFASHLFTSKWMEWIETISTRSDPQVILSCMGCGQFWHREALQNVIALGEPECAYLELQLPTVAHHLGYRARGLAHQDQFISNHVVEGASPDLLRSTGGWVMHPLKDLWSSAESIRISPTRISHEESTDRPPSRLDKVVEAMAMGWFGNLDDILQRIGRVASGRYPLYILRGGRRLAIALPKDRSAARIVLNLYHPNKTLGGLFRFFTRCLLRIGLTESILKPQGGGEELPLVDWLKGAAEGGKVGFVGGNPSHGPRCLLGGLCEIEDGSWIPFVAKLGFDQSRAAIEREWRNLKELAGRFPGILRPLSFDAGDDWALLRLPHLGYRAPRGMEDPCVMDLLIGWWGEAWSSLGQVAWAADLLDRAEACGACPKWCERMRALKIRSALVHGDFAIWNIRMLQHGPCAIDWEWAVELGVAGIDLAHGLRQEAVMVKRLSSSRAVKWILSQAGSTPYDAHLRGCGWEESIEDWLCLGLLHSHFNAQSKSLDLLSELGLNLKEPSMS
jgi:hypothetical protein